MNVAVDAALRRQGIASALMTHLFEPADRPGEQYTLEVRDLERRGDRALRAVRLPRRGAPPRLLPRQPRGRPDHVAHGRRRARRDRRDPRRSRRAATTPAPRVVTARRRDPVERHRLAGPAARPLRRRRAGDRLAPPPRAASTRSSTTRSSARARRSTTSSTVAVTRGPGLIGALLVGVSAAKALAAARGLPLVAGRPPARPRDGQHARRRPDRAAVPVPRRERRPHVPRPRRRPDARTRVLGQTLDDAAGEAFDKGARLLGPRLPRRARARPPGARRRPGARSTSRASQPGDGLDFSLQRAEDRRCSTRSATWRAGGRAARADLAASYQRAIVDALIARVEQALERERARAARASAAASRPTRELRERASRGSACRVYVPAARAVHRQRGDDRRRRPLHAAPLPYPRLPGPRRGGAAVT